MQLKYNLNPASDRTRSAQTLDPRSDMKRLGNHNKDSTQRCHSLPESISCTVQVRSPAVSSYKSIRQQLTVATCSLLTAIPVLAIDTSPLDISLSSMIYSEDGRVLVNEDVIEVQKEIDDDEFVTVRYIFDVMTGPSHNGLPKLDTPQTLTSPSGSTVTSKTSEEPTFAFRDTRHALNLEWEKPITRLLSTTNAVSISGEYDYLSAGGSSSWNYDINDRLTTLTAGVAANYDLITPVGGTPLGLGSSDSEKNLGDQKKGELDALIGITQVIDRKTLLQANYSIGYSKGYLTDPYKLVAYLNNVDLVPVSDNPYFYEKRPNTRLTHAFYLQLIRDFDDDVLRAAYRYFIDDWQIKSHTYELKYSFSLLHENELQFHYRYYTQTAADFYHYFLINDARAGVNNHDVVTELSQLEYASADHRLGNLKSETIGVKYSQRFVSKQSKLDLRLDRMIQQDQKGKFNDLKAWIAQIVFKFIY